MHHAKRAEPKHEMLEVAHPVQTRVLPKYSDDARRPASSEWKNATAGSSNRLPGVDYEKLNATLARYFENATLVENAKTQAIVVIYKVSIVAEVCSPSTLVI